MRHDICFPLYVEVDEIYNIACPASPVHYQFDQSNTEDLCACALICWGFPNASKEKSCRPPQDEVYGDPTGASTTGDLLGAVNRSGAGRGMIGKRLSTVLTHLTGQHRPD